MNAFSCQNSNFQQCDESSNILFIPNQPMHNIYQYIKAAMNLSEEIISICQQNIQNGTQKYMDQLTYLFTSPLEHINVMSVIGDPYVGFMYCLIIKGHINKVKRSSISRQTLTCVKGTQSEESFLILKEASQRTNFYRNLEAKYQEQHTKKSNKDFLTGKNKQSDHNQLNDEQFSRLWYQSLLFMDVLLASKSSTFSANKSNNGVLKGQTSLFQEIFAKLIIIIFLELPSLSSKQQLFQNIIKNIAFTGQTQLKSSKISLLNIIWEIVKYLIDQEEPSRIKYVVKSFGWKMINIAMTQFKQSLMSYHQNFELVQKGVEIINQFYNLISLPSFGNKISKGQPFFSLQARRIQKANENNQQNQFRTDTIICLGSIFQSMSWEYLENIFNSCLEIFEKITLGTAFNDGLSMVEQSLTFVTEMMLKRWVEKVKKYGLDQDTTQGDFYTESIMIGILSNLFNSNISIALENNQLLIVALDQFCLDIVRLIPISISEGEKSPLCSLFYFLVELYKNFKSINICNREIDILSKIQRIAQQFLIKSTINQQASQYPDFKDEIQVSSQFFAPYFQLVEQIYFNSTDEILFAYFQKIQQVIINYTVSYTTPKTVGTLVIQLIKSIDQSNGQDVLYRKFELFFFLLTELKKVNNIHFLKLLDEISIETIMSLEDQIAGKPSDLNSYIQRTPLHTFETFFTDIVNQIVNFLYTCESPYLISYNMHILTQLCGRLKNLQTSGRSKSNFNQLMSTSRYLEPIENFVEKMNFTNLQNMDNHSQRLKIFELIALIGVNNIQKVYWLYELVQRNLQPINHDSLLRFVVDTSGILNKKGRLDLQQAIIQLIFSDLNNNQNILNCFDETSLKNDTYFTLYCQFLSKIVKKMELHSMKNDQLAARFETLFFSRFNILHKLYDQQNCKTIHELWILYSKVNKLYGYFPAIPTIIFTCQLSSQLVQILFNRLHCLSSIKDVVSLYLNVFQRKKISFQEYIGDESRKQLTGLDELPKYLHILADYIDIKGIEIFFDYKTIIKGIFIGLYRNYKQCNSSGATLDSFGLDDQYEQASVNSTVNYLEEFYLKFQYRKKVSFLIKSKQILQCVETGVSKSFAETQKEFMEQTSDLVQGYKL